MAGLEREVEEVRNLKQVESSAVVEESRRVICQLEQGISALRVDIQYHMSENETLTHNLKSSRE